MKSHQLKKSSTTIIKWPFLSSRGGQLSGHVGTQDHLAFDHFAFEAHQLTHHCVERKRQKLQCVGRWSWLCNLHSRSGVVFERGQYDLPCVEFAYLNINEACIC